MIAQRSRLHQSAAPARAFPAAHPRLAARDGRLLLGVVDRRPDRSRAHPARADHRQADPLDAEPAGARARDEGDPAEVEARQATPERRADEVLPREQDQPGRLVPADRPPDPDLHLAVLRAAPLRRAGPAALRGLRRLAPSRRHHRAGEGRLGTVAPRHLRREPAFLVVLHVDDDAGRAAHSPDGAARALRSVHPQLSRRTDALLADDEPLDDGSGARDAQADAEARRAREAELAHPGEGRARRRRTAAARRPPRTALLRRGSRSAGPPRRVKRKRGGGGTKR